MGGVIKKYQQGQAFDGAKKYFRKVWPTETK